MDRDEENSRMLRSLLMSERLQHKEVIVISHPVMDSSLTCLSSSYTAGYRLVPHYQLEVKDLKYETLVGLMVAMNRASATFDLIKKIKGIIIETLDRVMEDIGLWRSSGHHDVTVIDCFHPDGVWECARQLMLSKGWRRVGINDISSCTLSEFSLDLSTSWPDLRSSGEMECIIPKVVTRRPIAAESHGSDVLTGHDCVVTREIGTLGTCRVYRDTPAHFRHHIPQRDETGIRSNDVLFTDVPRDAYTDEAPQGRYDGRTCVSVYEVNYDHYDYHSAVVVCPDSRGGLDRWYLPGIFLQLPTEISFMIWDYAGCGWNFDTIELLGLVVRNWTFDLMNHALMATADGIVVNPFQHDSVLVRWVC